MCKSLVKTLPFKYRRNIVKSSARVARANENIVYIVEKPTTSAMPVLRGNDAACDGREPAIDPYNAISKVPGTLLITYCRRRRHSSDEYARLMIESLTGFCLE